LGRKELNLPRLGWERKRKGKTRFQSFCHKGKKKKKKKKKRKKKKIHLFTTFFVRERGEKTGPRCSCQGKKKKAGGKKKVSGPKKTKGREKKKNRIAGRKKGREEKNMIDPGKGCQLIGHLSKKGKEGKKMNIQNCGKKRGGKKVLKKGGGGVFSSNAFTRKKEKKEEKGFENPSECRR